MTDRLVDIGDGLSVPDGVALVAGAAVGSVHVRGLIQEDLFGPGWVVIWLTFAWIALTAAGTFVYVVRRHVRKPQGYPGIGDRLWALMGLPWLFTAFLRNTPDGGSSSNQTLVNMGLGIGLFIVCLSAFFVVWATWVNVTPDRASATFSGPWSNRLGIVLAIAWPVQCGVGMVVIS